MSVWREEGIALVVAMMVLLLLSALGAALVLTTSSETIISNNFRNSEEALYAADAALERALVDIATVPDWDQLLDGRARSAFADGSPGGDRSLPDGSKLDLSRVLNQANCGKATTCSAAEMDASTTLRPWGSNNPRWQLYAYGRLADLLPDASVSSSYYVLVMVADDPSECDDDPLHDGGAPVTCPANPPGVLSLHAEAFGPHGIHRVVEMTVARTVTSGVSQGYTGQAARDDPRGLSQRQAVQTPGTTLTKMEMSLSAGGFAVNP